MVCHVYGISRAWHVTSGMSAPGGRHSLEETLQHEALPRAAHQPLSGGRADRDARTVSEEPARVGEGVAEVVEPRVRKMLGATDLVRVSRVLTCVRCATYVTYACNVSKVCNMCIACNVCDVCATPAPLSRRRAGTTRAAPRGEAVAARKRRAPDVTALYR